MNIPSIRILQAFLRSTMDSKSIKSSLRFTSLKTRMKNNNISFWQIFMKSNRIVEISRRIMMKSSLRSKLNSEEKESTIILPSKLLQITSKIYNQFTISPSKIQLLALWIIITDLNLMYSLLSQNIKNKYLISKIKSIQKHLCISSLLNL